jgi:hypothetical protein
VASRRPVLLAAVLSLAGAYTIYAQTSGPASRPSDEPELPEAVRGALSQIQDGAFNFDQPGFYAVVEFVRHSPHSPGFAETPVAVADWRDLLERPSEFRGRPVTIEGLVGHNKDPYTLPSRPDLGLLTQLELRRDDQPLACTLVFTGSAADIAIGARVSATGYFVQLRQYYDAGKHARPAALIVAPGPTTVGRAAARAAAGQWLDWRWLAGAIVAGVLLTLLLLRWSGRNTPCDVRSLRASQEAPVNLADDLAHWAERGGRDDR